MMNENTLMSCKKQMHIPQDVLSEILSRIDVDSLLRFKTVCKEWCNLIEDHTFIRSHMMKSRGRWVFETVNRYNYDSYGFLDSCFGLILEHNYITQNPRLRNPSTRKILELPHPGKHRPRDMKMCRTKSSDVLKLVVRSEYYKGIHANEKLVCICKVLTVGIDLRWRDIDIPLPSGAHACYGETVMVREVYFMFVTNNIFEFEVICLEVGNEEIYSIKIPNVFLSNRLDVRAMAWGEGLALVSAVGYVEVHIWVLEDHKEIRFAEKMIVVPLKFADPESIGGAIVGVFMDNGLLMNFDEEKMLLDIPSGKVKQRFPSPQLREFAYYYLIPSLEHPSLRK